MTCRLVFLFVLMSTCTGFSQPVESSSSSNASAIGSNRLSRATPSLIWPRAFVAGSTSTVWLADTGSLEVAKDHDSLNVTIRLADAERVYEEKSVTSRLGLISPVELAIPFRYDGQLTIRVECAESRCQRQELPVHPLDVIQSLSLRLERAVYRPDDVVSIWLACLDHRGQIIAPGQAESASSARRATMMTDAIQVAVHDPNNVIVQYWSVPLAGLENLAFQLSDQPQQSGVWTVRATVGDATAVQSFRLVDSAEDANSPNQPLDDPVAVDPALTIESHFVELTFSPRTVSIIQQGSPFAGELVASTSERGIIVGLDVLDHHGTSVHHQEIHLNRTSSAIFTIPALMNLTTNATLQGTLQSIEGQPLDNQFVLATHPLVVTARSETGQEQRAVRGPCNVQLFSLNGQYRFVEGELLRLAVYSSCALLGNRINYAVTSRSSGHLVSWSQEYLVETLQPTSGSAGHLFQINLSIPIVYEMIPRAIVTVFFPRDDDDRHLASSSLDIAVRADSSQSTIDVINVRGNKAKVNLTLKTRQRHCLYGSPNEAAELEDDPLTVGPLFASSIETDGFLRLLPKYQQTPPVWQIFGTFARDLWYVRCFDTGISPSSANEEFVSKELELIVPVGQNAAQLTLLSIDAAGRARRSPSLKLPLQPADWTIDFQLPDTVRVGEEIVVDVAISNRFQNCSQVQLQMALNGGGVFVSNDKKFLQQPACLAQKSRSVYRVGILVKEISKMGKLAFTVQVKGSRSATCCAPTDVILLDSHIEPVETLPVTKSVRVLAKDFEHRQIDSYLFCLEEKVFVSNASVFKYDVMPLGNNVKAVVFQATAAADLRIALGKTEHLNNDDDDDGTAPAGSVSSYHLVLGGEDNMYSWISKQKNGLTEVKTKVTTPKLLRPDRLQTFWISWDQPKSGRRKRNNKPAHKDHQPHHPHGRQQHQQQQHGRPAVLTFGKGSRIGVRPLLSIPLESEEDIAFRFIGFSTGWGFHGFFRVWGTDGNTDETIQSLSLGKPDGSVSNLAAEVAIKGGLISVLDDIWSFQSETDTLLGVLEQLYRDRIVKTRHRPEVHDWNGILQNMLYFRLADGSFRNEESDYGNLRLTALAVHALSSIRLQSYSDPSLLKSSLAWLHGQQNEDGSFDLESGNSTIEERIVVTAFVLTALADVQHDDIILYQVCSAAQRFLEAQLTVLTTNVKLIVPSATAVLVSHSSLWPATLTKLDSVYNLLLDCYSKDSADCLSEVSYALTAYLHQNQHDKAFVLIRTLVGARWDNLSPLDKVRTMKAWSKYNQVVNDPVRNLDMHITFQNGGVTLMPSLKVNVSETVNGTEPVPLDDEVPDANNASSSVIESSEEQQNVRLHTPPLTYDVPSLPQNIETAITGAGCALLQTKVHWTTAEPPSLLHPLFSIFSAIENKPPTDKDEPPSALSIELCIKLNDNHMADLRVKIAPFSSFIISNATASDGLAALEYKTRYNYTSVDLRQVKPQCARCMKLETVRKGLIRNIHPGRIEIYKTNRSHERHQFALRGLPNKSLWVDETTYDTISYLKERPATCS